MHERPTESGQPASQPEPQADRQPDAQPWSASPPPPYAAAPMPPYQAPQTWAPVPPRKPKHTARNGGLGCLGLIVLLVIISAALSSKASNSGPSAGTGPGTVAVATSPAPTAADGSLAPASALPATSAAPQTSSVPQTSAPPAPTTQVVLKVSGSGIKSTKTFTTGDEWSISYSFDCSSFGSEGNFQIYVYDGGELGDVPVNALARKGSDVTYEHSDSGDHYLQINSECSWKVTVTDGD